MTILPFALLIAAVSAAAPKPPVSGDEPAPPKVDRDALSPEARDAHDRETARRWSQDPALGHSECLDDKQGARKCMEDRLSELKDVAKPEQYAVIQSYVKLLPRGVSAPLPAAGSEKSGGSSPAGSQAPASALAFGPAPAAPRASDFRAGPGSVSFAPVPAAPPQTPAPGASPSWWQEQYDLYMCFYVPSRCSK